MVEDETEKTFKSNLIKKLEIIILFDLIITISHIFLGARPG